MDGWWQNGGISDAPAYTWEANLCDARAAEGHDDGHDVDGELELQELGDAVVDVPPPHHRLHDAGEVVVCQDDVGRLLGHVGTGDALSTTQQDGHAVISAQFQRRPT